MENNSRRGIKMAKYIFAFFIIVEILWWWGYSYYPIHHGKDTATQELTLIYALNELKEIKNEQIMNIKEQDIIGGNRILQIEVQGNMHDIFSEYTMAQNGWQNILINEESIHAYRSGYCIKILQKYAYYEINISAT